MFACTDFCTTSNEIEEQIVYYEATTAVSKQINTFSISEMLHQKNFIKMISSQYNSYVKKCEKNNEKFVDPQFPPNAENLDFTANGRKLVWKRIPEIFKKCKIIEGQIEPSDVQQGNIGDCYFLAVLSALAEQPQRIHKIFQNNMQINQHGIYKLIVNIQGKPTQLVIDDYIPVIEYNNRPVFCKSKNSQVWVILIEKAWAKLSGSYKNISSGYPHEVLNAFAVAPCFYEQISPEMSKKSQQAIWAHLMHSSRQNFPVCCGSIQNTQVKGLKSSHTYTLLNSYEINNNQIQHRIIKLRNPWGDTQYTGNYSQFDSQFWNKISIEIKKKVFNKIHQNDGIFTIPFSIFLENFNSLDISHIKKNFNYNFQTIAMAPNQQLYFLLQVQQQAQFYLTLEKSFSRSACLNNKNRSQYGYLKILICQQIDENTYEYIDSKLQISFPDITQHCQKLKIGSYVIMLQGNMPNQLVGFQTTLSVYSQAMVKDLIPIKKPSYQFLSNMFKREAIQRNENKVQISSNVQDWLQTKFEYIQGGFGYVCVNLGSSSNIKVKLSYILSDIRQDGYRVHQKPPENYQFLVDEGQIEIIVFSVDLTHNVLLQFPPSGLSISYII